MSAAQRSAALRHWASVDDPAAQTAAGRAKFLDSFEQKATPEGRYSPEERAKRAERLRRAYFIELAERSAKARRAKSLKSRIPQANPAVSQHDRDVIENVGLADVDEHPGADEPKLLHVDESTPS